jgi:zeaxanthin glucosyltransferase
MVDYAFIVVPVKFFFFPFFCILKYSWVLIDKMINKKDMAKIVFICEMEEGHLLPTFRLAHSLKRKGHEIAFLSVLDNEQLIREQGFSFYHILENIYPRGHRKMMKQNSYIAGRNADHDSYRKNHTKHIVRGAYDPFINEIKADLFIMSFYLSFDALYLYYKYKIRPVMMCPVIHGPEKTMTSDCHAYIMEMDIEEQFLFVEMLTELGVDVSSFDEVVKPLNTFTQLVLCPREFKISQMNTRPNVNYIEPSIRKANLNKDVHALYNIQPGKKIIYASLGSQALRHGKTCDVFFDKIINVMKEEDLQDIHLLLSVDPLYDQSKLATASDNVKILQWAPQIDILQVAAVAIIHGGLGSVKECIYYGVPMIVLPLGFDQNDNAKRVAYHKMGYTDDIETMPEDVFKSYILKALSDAEIKTGIQRMQKIFQDYEEHEPGAGIIENILQMRKEKALTHTV